MIVYKIKYNKIVGISRKDENYVIKENEYQSNTWHQKPFFNGTEVVETITQAEIDEQTEQKIKQDRIKKYNEDNVVIWQGKSIDGLRDLGLSIDGNDKLKVIEII